MAYKVIVKKTSGRTGLGYALRMNDAALRVMSPRRRMQTIARGINRSVYNWRAKYFWKRFHKAHVLGSPWNYKLDKRSPLQWRHSGPAATRNAVYTGKITTRKQQKTGIIRTRIPIPQGHATHPEILAVWATVPREEIEWMAEEAAENIKRIIDSGGPKRKKPSKKVMEARRLRRNETNRARYARNQAAKGFTVRSRGSRG